MLGSARGLVDTVRVARLVREPVRFTTRQALRRRVLARYRIRESGLAVYLRHNTSDVNTLDEIFRLGHYGLPESVDAVLRDAPPPEIADLGANIGLFGIYALGRFPGAAVTAFEPNPANAHVLRLTVEANRHVRWRIVEAAAAVRNGEVRFAAGTHFTTGHVTEAGDVVVPAVDVFEHVAAASWLKIDIEGAEWEILSDPRFATLRARVVALEYHADGSPEADARRAAETLLRKAGYLTAASAFPMPPGHGMLWAWKTP